MKILHTTQVLLYVFLLSSTCRKTEPQHLEHVVFFIFGIANYNNVVVTKA